MREMQTVVVGYDSSNDAERALAASAEMIADGGVVHVVVAYKPLSTAEVEQMWRELPAEFRSSFDSLAVPEGHLTDATRVLDRLGVNNEGHLVDDAPAAAILDIAESVGADLVVVGSRGLGRAARFVRGSVSTRVFNHAPCDVYVVHHHDD